MSVILLLGFCFTTLILFGYCFYVFLISMLPAFKEKECSTRKSRAFHLYMMIPCMNEERVVGETLSCLVEKAPKDSIIYVIDDASTDSTASIVEGFGRDNVRLHRRIKPNAQKGKGEALNDCLQTILRDIAQRGISQKDTIIGVFDADAYVDDAYFSEILSYFEDPEVGQVQSRIRMIKTDTLLQQMQDFEFALSNTAIQNAREYSNSVCMGGNGQFVRLSALLTLGNRPWGSCLLEDFEIGLKLLLNGFKAKFARKAPVEQQALKSVKRYIRQRSRWVQGNIQAAHYIVPILKASVHPLIKIDLLYFIAQSWTNLLGIILQTALLVVLFFNLSLFLQAMPSFDFQREVANMALLFALSFAPLVSMLLWRWKNHDEKIHFWHEIKCTLLMPIYSTLSFPSILIAFYRFFTKKTAWLKTSRDV